MKKVFIIDVWTRFKALVCKLIGLKGLGLAGIFILREKDKLGDWPFVLALLIILGFREAPVWISKVLNPTGEVNNERG